MMTDYEKKVGWNKLTAWLRLVELLNEDDADYDYPLSPVHDQFPLKDIHTLRYFKRQEVLELLEDLRG